MEIKGELLEIKYPVEFGSDYCVVRHVLYDQVIYIMKLAELEELSQLTEALLQELKGEQE